MHNDPHPSRDPYCLRVVSVGFLLSAICMIGAILAAGSDLIGW